MSPAATRFGIQPKNISSVLLFFFLPQLHPETAGGEGVLHVTGGSTGRGQGYGGDMRLPLGQVSLTWLLSKVDF